MRRFFSEDISEPTSCLQKKLQSNKRICSEVSVNSPAIRGVSREEEEKEGYGGRDSQKRKILE